MSDPGAFGALASRSIRNDAEIASDCVLSWRASVAFFALLPTLSLEEIRLAPLGGFQSFVGRGVPILCRSRTGVRFDLGSRRNWSVESHLKEHREHTPDLHLLAFDVYNQLGSFRTIGRIFVEILTQ